MNKCLSCISILMLISIGAYYESYGFPARRLAPAVIAQLIKKKEQKPKQPRRLKRQQLKPSLPPTISSNIISANTGDGVFINNHSNNNFVQDNVIGLNSALAPLGNGQDGIAIENTSNNNVIGGILPANGNIIAYNKKGVVVGANKCDLSVGNSIQANSIYNNKCIGIDLANDGFTENHKSSPSVGPNNFQNFPVLEKALIKAGNTLLQGTLTSIPSTTFVIQFFSNSRKEEEGKTQIGQLIVSTDATGKVSFTTTQPEVASGTFITATATRLNTNGISTDTSEFSKPIEVKTCK